MLCSKVGCHSPANATASAAVISTDWGKLSNVPS
ncbi:CxxxxCH/CxxCH domain-containing protein [Nostoc sp. FACHB-190]